MSNSGKIDGPDSGASAAIGKFLEYLDSTMMHNEGMTVSGGIQAGSYMVYFAPDADGVHRITGAGPK